MNNFVCSKSNNKRHNFAKPGQNCINGCGVNQTVLSGQIKKIKRTMFKSTLTFKKSKMNKYIHSELHEIIDKMRKEFGETAIKGIGSFSFYLGLLKHLPISIIYQWLAEIKDSPKLNTPTTKAKIFWYKFKKWKNN